MAILHRRLPWAQGVSFGSRPCISVQCRMAVGSAVSATSGVCFDEIYSAQRLHSCQAGWVWFVCVSVSQLRAWNNISPWLSGSKGESSRGCVRRNEWEQRELEGKLLNEVKLLFIWCSCPTLSNRSDRLNWRRVSLQSSPGGTG